MLPANQIAEMLVRWERLRRAAREKDEELRTSVQAGAEADVLARLREELDALRVQFDEALAKVAANASR